MSPGFEATLFYVSVAVFAGGIVRIVRASIERHVRDGLGLAIAVGGGVGLIVTVIAFVTGPKTLLPF